MSLIKKNIFIILFVVLAVGNIYIFVAGMYLGDDINKFENEAKTLTQENKQLERDVVQAESLQYAASLSARLNFTKQSQPVFFDNLKYALNR